jgi:hypothetical protein
MRKTLRFLVLALLSGGAFLWTGASQAQYRGVRRVPIRPPIYRPNFPPNRMPGWDWWRIYPWSPYDYGRKPYNPAWYPPGYLYPQLYAPSAAAGAAADRRRPKNAAPQSAQGRPR